MMAETAELPDVLAFAGEFGAEVNSFVPFAYWLHLAGQMRTRRVLTYAGMRPFYFFLDPGQVEERSEPRAYVEPHRRPAWLPTRDDHRSVRNPFEVFPDYRQRYRNTLFAAEKPILVVHNKYTQEWSGPPVNFLCLPMLDRIFAGLNDRFTIIYTRPGITVNQAGFSGDAQPDAALGDLQVLRRHPSVLLFEDLARSMSGERSYNELKLMLYANTHHYITVQGGNAHLCSLFSGSLVGILHRLGHEIVHSYERGHFQYAANPRPDYLICRTEDELSLALDVFAGSFMAQDRVMLARDTAEIAAVFSPSVQCGLDKMDPVP